MGKVGADYHDTYENFREIMPEVEVIITGTNWSNAISEVLSQESDLKIPIFFNNLPDGTKVELPDIIKHKSNIINSIGITKYYENQQEQIKLLSVLCPNCKFIHVGNKGEISGEKDKWII